MGAYNGQSGLLVDRTNANCVLLFAIPATPEIPAVALARFGIGHLVDFNTATLHTARSRAPTLFFKELNCGQFVRAGERNLRDYVGL